MVVGPLGCVVGPKNLSLLQIFDSLQSAGANAIMQDDDGHQITVFVGFLGKKGIFFDPFFSSSCAVCSPSRFLRIFSPLFYLTFFVNRMGFNF